MAHARRYIAAASMLGAAVFSFAALTEEPWTWPEGLRLENQDRAWVEVAPRDDAPLVIVLGDQGSEDTAPPWRIRLGEHFGDRIVLHSLGDTTPARFPGLRGIAFREVKQRTEELGYDVLLVFDKKLLRRLRYEAGLPNVYVVDPDYAIVLHHTGEIDAGWDDVVAGIDAQMRPDQATP